MRKTTLLAVVLASVLALIIYLARERDGAAPGPEVAQTGPPIATEPNVVDSKVRPRPPIVRRTPRLPPSRSGSTSAEDNEMADALASTIEDPKSWEVWGERFLATIVDLEDLGLVSDERSRCHKDLGAFEERCRYSVAFVLKDVGDGRARIMAALPDMKEGPQECGVYADCIADAHTGAEIAAPTSWDGPLMAVQRNYATDASEWSMTTDPDYYRQMVKMLHEISAGLPDRDDPQTKYERLIVERQLAYARRMSASDD